MNAHTEPTVASNAARLDLDISLLHKLHPEWSGFSGALLCIIQALTRRPSLATALRRHLSIGDARAAVVLSSRPHLIAAYTDELDAVAVIRVPAQCRNLVPSDLGARLISVNTYWEYGAPPTDIHVGQHSTGTWVSFHPVIASFVSRDHRRMDELKSRIESWEWDRAARLGSNWIDSFGAARARDGQPGWSGVPIEQVRH